MTESKMINVKGGKPMYFSLIFSVRDRGDSPRRSLAWFCASEEATSEATAAATKAAKAALAKADSPTPTLWFDSIFNYLYRHLLEPNTQ